MKYSSSLPKKLLVLAVVAAPLTFFTPAASADLTYAQTLVVRSQLDASISNLTSQLETAATTLTNLKVVARLAPNVNASGVQSAINTLTPIVNSLTNQLVQLNRKRAVVVQLSEALRKLRVLQAQVKANIRRFDRIENRTRQTRFAGRRLNREVNNVFNDETTIQSLQQQIATLQQQYNQIQNGG